MAISLPNHHLDDPLSHSSFLSLFRKTAGGSLTRAANSEQQEPQLVHEFLKPMAKMILDSNSDPPKSDLLHQALSQDEDITSAVNATERPQRRRLAMGGRKRSQFSLRPSISQSSSNVDTTSNILQLKDPEEFFLAFERSDKADRFLKKLRGENATNVTQYHQPAKTRARRLGISGKTYSYKHPTLPDISEKHSLSKEENLEANGNFVSSQTEKFSPADGMFHTGVNNHMQEAPDMADTSQEMETSDSEICDVTQQKDSVAMLENSFGKLLATLMSSCEDLDGGGTVSLLQEHLGVKPIDLPKLSLPSLTAPTSCFSPLEKLSSRRAEEVPATALSALRKLVSTSNDQSGPTTDSCLMVDGHSENLSIPTELNNAEYQAHKVPPKRQNKRKAVQHKKNLGAATADSSFPVDGHSENLSVLAELNNKENQAPKISSQRRSKRKSVQVREILGARSSPTADSCLPVDGPSENLNISTEFNIEENWAPKVSPKKQNRRKAVQRRDSLAGAGTVWKSGVRRSTRIRTRPLEDWRGERFLYARIHDSLTTVIGLKYASPAKDGSDRTPVFKVKSYVSEEYADLVKKAAL